MTADWARVTDCPPARRSSRLIDEVPVGKRGALDITSKPPGTSEWE